MKITASIRSTAAALALTLFAAPAWAAPVPAEAPKANDEADADVQTDLKVLREIHVRDGKPIRGYIEATDDKTLEVRLETGGVILVRRAHVLRIEAAVRREDDEAAQRFLDPNRTRYFYTPSAMTLRQGEGYFSQKQLLFSAVAYGVTDHVTVLAGAMLPLWLAGPEGFNLIGGIKVGGQVAPSLHVGGGAETFILPTFGSARVRSVGFVFGNLTLGDRDAHVTVAAGYPFALTSRDSALGNLIITLNGNLRMTDRLALVSENWLINGFENRLRVLDSVGVRLVYQQVAWDFGFIGMPTENVSFVLPWVDFTYNF